MDKIQNKILYVSTNSPWIYNAKVFDKRAVLPYHKRKRKGARALYQISFYRDKNGREPVVEYLRQLSSRTDKDSRIKANKISDYISALRKYGTHVGEPYVKHLQGEIWELRPLRDRVLFAAWDGKSFLLLHCFVKRTQKTPQREIEQAKRNLADYRERSQEHGKKPGV